MQLVNALEFDALDQSLTGTLTVIPEGNADSVVDFAMDLPGLKPFGGVVGQLKCKLTRPGQPLWMQLVGPWLHAVVVPVAGDLTGDGVVDGADIGQATANWSGDGTELGQVLAATGACELVVAHGSISVPSGAGSASVTLLPALGVAAALPAGAVAKYRFRALVSAGTKLVVTPEFVFTAAPSV